MIRVEGLGVRAGDFELHDIGFVIPSGQYGILMGKTGSGKTTILEAICGLKEILHGNVTLNGRDVTRAPAGRRGIGFVPQEATLFSSMTVRQHLGFGPKVQGWSKSDISSRVNELAAQLNLENLLSRKPFGLSGGERQRVSLGRALAVRPQVLCLDEPLSALDEETHSGMIELIQQLVKDNKITTLHITHSPREANQIADRILRLVEGRVIEANRDSEMEL